MTQWIHEYSVWILVAMMTTYLLGSALYLYSAYNGSSTRINLIATACPDIKNTLSFRSFFQVNSGKVIPPAHYKEFKLSSAFVSLATIFIFGALLLVLPREPTLSSYIPLVDIYGTLPQAECSALPTDAAKAECIAQAAKQQQKLQAFRVGALEMMIVGYLSAYIWSLNMIMRRVISRDVSAVAFNLISIRVVISVILSLITYHMVVGNPLEGNETQTIPWLDLPSPVFLALFIGYFPDSILNFFHDKVRRNIKQNMQSAHLDLEFIEGIDVFTRSRLLEAEIPDAHALATANPLALYYRTPFSILQIMDWIGQAQLFLLVKDEQMTQLRGVGVRTIYGLLTALNTAPQPPAGDGSTTSPPASGLTICGVGINICVDSVKVALATEPWYKRAIELNDILTHTAPAKPSP